MLFGCRIFFLMRLGVHDGSLDVAWFCVSMLGGSWAGEMNVSFVVVVGGIQKGLCVDFECNRPSFLATVFAAASKFNGDLNKWNVAAVTTMEGSKPIRIVENDMT